MWMTSIIILITLGILRVLYVICKILVTTDRTLEKNTKSLCTIICIGSGGHTAEMLKIVERLNAEKYQPRKYILADNDFRSEARIHHAENGRKNYTITKFRRSSDVEQLYGSSIFSTLCALANSLPVVYKLQPDVILCNGPRTYVPICIIAFLLKCMFILNCRIVFIESICRIRTLSLTGRILQYFADVFVVQWPQLRDECFRAKYYGKLV